MITVEFNVEKREETGSGAVGRLRKQGYIPGIFYGKDKPVNIKIKTADFVKITHGRLGDNVLISLLFKEDKTKKMVILKEMQKDAIKGDFLHLDFSEISLTQKIHTTVHVVALGEAKGVKEGGILEFHHRDISIECLPTDIPEKVVADISELAIGQSIHVRDLVFPATVKVLTQQDDTVLSVVAPRREEEVAAPEAEGAEPAAAEPEVIAKGKKDKEEEAAAEEGKTSPKEGKTPPKK